MAKVSSKIKGFCSYKMLISNPVVIKANQNRSKSVTCNEKAQASSSQGLQINFAIFTESSTIYVWRGNESILDLVSYQ